MKSTPNGKTALQVTNGPLAHKTVNSQSQSYKRNVNLTKANDMTTSRAKPIKEKIKEYISKPYNALKEVQIFESLLNKYFVRTSMTDPKSAFTCTGGLAYRQAMSDISLEW